MLRQEVHDSRWNGDSNNVDLWFSFLDSNREQLWYLSIPDPWPLVSLILSSKESRRDDTCRGTMHREGEARLWIVEIISTYSMASSRHVHWVLQKEGTVMYVCTMRSSGGLFVVFSMRGFVPACSRWWGRWDIDSAHLNRGREGQEKLLSSIASLHSINKTESSRLNALG